MAPSTRSMGVELEKTIRQLRAERQQHVQAIASIDATFEQFGISGNGHGRRPGRPKGTKSRRTRGTFSVNAEQFILGLLKGGRALTTKEINTRWKQAGRGGSADNTLTKLGKEKKVRRKKIKDGRGSTYATT